MRQPDWSKLPFDLSEFHPLGHWAFSSTCASYAGGGVRHLRYWWRYELSPLDFLGRQTLCRVGRHVPEPYWTSALILMDDRTPPDGHACARCAKELYE